jgi:hypothetical protein
MTRSLQVRLEEGVSAWCKRKKEYEASRAVYIGPWLEGGGRRREGNMHEEAG